MKALLALLLLIPSLSWGSEEKARKLFVDASLEFGNRNCDLQLFKTSLLELMFLIQKAERYKDTVNDKELLLNEGKKLVKEGNRILEDINPCIDPYIEEVATRYDMIIKEHPSSEVAYELLKSNEYVSVADAKEFKFILKDIGEKLDTFKAKIFLIENKLFPYDE